MNKIVTVVLESLLILLMHVVNTQLIISFHVVQILNKQII